MRGAWIVAIVGSAVLAVGCSAKAAETEASRAAATAAVSEARATPSPAPRPKACALVSQSEMSAILGGAVGTPAGKEGPDTTACRYSPANDNAISPYAHVAIDWDAGDEAMGANKLAAKLLGKDAGFSIAEPIEGLGDEASAMIGGVINVRKGRTFIKITLGAQAHSKEKGTAIAKLILSRIESAGQ